MSQKTLNRIYEPFFTTKEKGTGIGLSIVYSIIKDHGEFIESDSDLGKETTFRIYLPDLVLLDIGMPGIGGIKSLQEMMGVDSKARVVIMSGYSGNRNIEEARKLGAKAFLQKPYHITDLLYTVRGVLDQYSGNERREEEPLKPNNSSLTY